MASNLEEANKKFMKQVLRSYFDPIYVEEFKIPKYYGKVTVMNGPASTILARSGRFDKMEHLKRAELFERFAVNAESQWSKVADKASQETFGRPFEFGDYKVSGIARSEYSEKRKDQLRKLAHSVTIFKTLARAHHDAAKIQGRYKNFYRSNPEQDTEVTRVIFRRFTGEGEKEVIAFFPDIEEGTGKILSYLHVGQHGAASIAFMQRGTKPASMKEPDVKALYDELTSIGYRLKVVQRMSRAKRNPPRARKYMTVIIGQSNYGQGWEDETSYPYTLEGIKEAKADKKAYAENSQYPFRTIHRRVKIEDYEAGNF